MPIKPPPLARGGDIDSEQMRRWFQQLPNEVESSVTGTALQGDGSTNVLRHLRLVINNGAGANTIKCLTSSLWNGDVVSVAEGIGKPYVGDDFNLDASGNWLRIEATYLSGNVLMATGHIATDPSNTTNATLDIYADSNDIKLAIRSGGTLQDLTARVDVGAPIEVYILYITDA